MDLKDLSIIITTFKSEEKIHSCLNSIPSSIRIIVVENSSNKLFKREIEREYKNVECLLTGDNKGYAVANNLGLSKVTSKYALVLNPDAKIKKNSLESFIASAKKYQDFWLMGPVNDQSEEFDQKSEKLIEVENLKGFAIFFNMEKFEQNFFDENFFLYFEEIDLCKRVRLKKGKIFLNPKIIIKHEGASSVKKDNLHELEKSRNWHWMWSTFYFHKKYKGFIFALALIFPKLVSAVLKIIFYFFTMKKKKRILYFYRLYGITNSILGKKSWYRPTLH